MKSIILALFVIFLIKNSDAQNITTNYFNAFDPTCDYTCDGSIEMQFMNGVAPYSIVTDISLPFQQLDDSTFLFENLCGGENAQLIVYDAIGDSSIYNGVGVAMIQPLDVIKTPVSPICSGGSDGMIDISISGGVPPYNYTINGWSTSQSSGPFLGLSAGVHIISMIDGNGCSIDGMAVTITEPNPISLSLTSGPDCGNSNVGCSGWVDVQNVSGGPAPFAFSWSNGTTTSFSTGLCPAVYTMQVTDANGCSATESVEVGSVSSPIEISVDYSHSSCADGMAEVSVMGGVGNLDISWLHGPTDPFLFGLNPGVYGVEVIDSLGCYDSIMFEIQDLGSGYCSYIEGMVYYDYNEDCNSAGDITLEGMFIKATPSSQTGLEYYAMTDIFGMYEFNVPFDTYTLTQINNPNYGDHCNGGSLTVTTTSFDQASFDNDFLDTLVTMVNARVYTWSTIIRPGFDTEHYINIQNYGGSIASGTLQVIYPGSQLSYSSAYPAPDNISGDTLFWDITNLNIQTQMFTIYGVATNVNIDDIVTICANIITNETDVDLSNNYLCHSDITTGSFDPNDKSVSPAGDITLNDYYLDYLIRFQNTGTDTAFNVEIIDTLSTLLEVSTFEILESSHPVLVELSGENVVKFSFSNILLPDSNTNEVASHGFVQFRIKQASGNSVGNTIENTAAIYFDFNEPIITNTTSSLIVAPLAIKGNENHEINCYPNPFTDELKVNGISNNDQIKVRDNLGRILFTRTSLSNNLIVNTDEWPKGIYFIEISSENYVRVEKLIKE